MEILIIESFIANIFTVLITTRFFNCYRLLYIVPQRSTSIHPVSDLDYYIIYVSCRAIVSTCLYNNTRLCCGTGAPAAPAFLKAPTAPTFFKSQANLSLYDKYVILNYLKCTQSNLKQRFLFG